MKEKNKPTVEEMIEAYRQYSRRIDEICRQLPPPKVDFTKLPPPYRHSVVVNRVCSSVLAAVVALVMWISPIPRGITLNADVDCVASVESIETILKNLS